MKVAENFRGTGLGRAVPRWVVLGAGVHVHFHFLEVSWLSHVLRGIHEDPRRRHRLLQRWWTSLSPALPRSLLVTEHL